MAKGNGKLHGKRNVPALIFDAEGLVLAPRW